MDTEDFSGSWDIWIGTLWGKFLWAWILIMRYCIFRNLNIWLLVLNDDLLPRLPAWQWRRCFRSQKTSLPSFWCPTFISASWISEYVQNSRHLYACRCWRIYYGSENVAVQSRHLKDDIGLNTTLGEGWSRKADRRKDGLKKISDSVLQGVCCRILQQQCAIL